MLLKKWNKISSLSLFTALTLVTLLNLNQPSLAGEEFARRSGDFVDTLGINIHLNYEDTSYRRYRNLIKPRLIELGVHHVRDGVPAYALRAQAKMRDLAKVGIKTLLIVDPKHFRNVLDSIPMIKTLLTSLEAVEGPNEWDWRPGVTYKNQGFPTGLRNFQSEFYTAIKQDPKTAHFRVLAPSLVQTSAASQLGAVPCDGGNMHTYLGSYPSEPGFFQKVTDAQAVCPDKPVTATEAGWYGLTTDPKSVGISEQVAGKLLPRLWLEFYNRGVERTYIYELIDLFPHANDKENRFGLLRFDGTPKPAFTALKNMTSLLSDQNTSFIPGSLNYSLQGLTTNIHHTLLQKGNRDFYLILWQEVPAFDTQKRDLAVLDRPITLTLGTRIRFAAAYRPLISDRALAVWSSPTSLRLQVPDHPLIIKLIPA